MMTFASAAPHHFHEMKEPLKQHLIEEDQTPHLLIYESTQPLQNYDIERI